MGFTFVHHCQVNIASCFIDTLSAAAKEPALYLKGGYRGAFESIPYKVGYKFCKRMNVLLNARLFKRIHVGTSLINRNHSLGKPP